MPQRPQDGSVRQFQVSILKRYASTASADRIFKKYAGLPKDTIAERYIKQQARVAGLAGALSSLVIAGGTVLSGAALVSTVGIPALAITIPVAIAAFGGEMAYTLRLQVRVAYDLCLLYGVPLDSDDPEDLWDIFLIELGAKSGDSIGRAVQQLVPKITQQQARRLLRAGLIRRRFQNWVAKNVSREIAARYLAEGFLLKVAVPGVSVVLGVGWNYLSTVGIGRAVRARMRGRGMSTERIDRLPISDKAPAELVLASALNALTINPRIHENEMTAYKQLGVRLRERDPGFDPQALDSVWTDQSYWMSHIATINDPEVQQTILTIVETMVLLDGRVRRNEVKLLKPLYKLFGQEFDRQRLKVQAQAFYVKPPAQACRITALVLAIVSLLLSCACVVSLIILAQSWTS